MPKPDSLPDVNDPKPAIRRREIAITVLLILEAIPMLMFPFLFATDVLTLEGVQPLAGGPQPWPLVLFKFGALLYPVFYGLGLWRSLSRGKSRTYRELWAFAPAAYILLLSLPMALVGL